jgi:hypothetical protein
MKVRYGPSKGPPDIQLRSEPRGILRESPAAGSPRLVLLAPSVVGAVSSNISKDGPFVGVGVRRGHPSISGSWRRAFSIGSLERERSFLT